MRSTIYRCWCPALGQAEDDCTAALATSHEHAAEQWAAWADAYLRPDGAPAVAGGAPIAVLVAAGAGAARELVVLGYLAAVYGACTPEQVEQLRQRDERPQRRGEKLARSRGELPPLPRPRRLTGTAITADGVAAIYTDQDLRALRVAAYQDGVSDQPTAEERAAAAEAYVHPVVREAAEYERSTGRRARD